MPSIVAVVGGEAVTARSAFGMCLAAVACVMLSFSPRRGGEGGVGVQLRNGETALALQVETITTTTATATVTEVLNIVELPAGNPLPQKTTTPRLDYLAGGGRGGGGGGGGGGGNFTPRSLRIRAASPSPSVNSPTSN